MNVAEWMFGDLLASARAACGRAWHRLGAARERVAARRRRRRAYDPAFAERLAARRRHDFVVESTIPHFDPLP